jgi:transmembrane 9 superfamily member 1
LSRYNNENDDLTSIENENYGWKLISNDVFRFPKNKIFLCAILGVGTQFLVLALSVLLLILLGLFNVHRHGSLNSFVFFMYALTSGISGYVSARTYRQMNGDKWVWNINLTACLYSVPFFTIWSIVNTAAWIYGSTQALPITTILLLLFVWITVGYPLTIAGGILGKNTLQAFDAPCRTKNICREIPSAVWYRQSTILKIFGGLFPFSAISIEIYYIFSTIWGRDQYTLYGILSIVFAILLCVTACISICVTYFLLASENYNWWWNSIISSG